MKITLFRPAIAMLALVTCAVQPVEAQTVTFATFQQVNFSSKPFTFTSNGTTGTFSTTATAINFNFSSIAGLAADLTGTQSATITITATTSTALSGTGSLSNPYNQVIDSGTITITRDSAAAEGSGSKTNLLTVTFSDSPATISGRNGSGNFDGSDPTVTFSSDFLNFSDATEAADFAIALTSITPSLGKSGNFLRNFQATGSGQFDSDAGPSFSPVPELGSMTLLGVGLFGGVTIWGFRRLRQMKEAVVCPALA